MTENENASGPGLGAGDRSTPGGSTAEPTTAEPTEPSAKADRSPEPRGQRPRLRSLDAFRGLAIAAMILVNNPGSWDYVYPPLEHAKWHGCTPTDLVFPFFMFAIGTAMAFSLGRYAERRQEPPGFVYGRLARRVAILVALGLALNFSSIALSALLQGKPWDFSKFRFLGVLQRIGLAYGLAAPIVLTQSRRWQAIGAAAVLFIYWALLGTNPTIETNPGGWLDRLVFGQQHLYLAAPSDPEGLLGAVPAAVSILVGYWVGQWLKTQQDPGSEPDRPSDTSLGLAAVGLGLVALGWLWSWGLPLNKALWTSSFVVYTSGWSMVVLAGLWQAIEVKHWRGLGWPLEVMGLNAIGLFVASGLVARVFYRLPIGSGNLQEWLFTTFFASWLGPWHGSLLMAIVTVAAWWLVSYGLDRRGWFFKV